MEEGEGGENEMLYPIELLVHGSRAEDKPLHSPSATCLQYSAHSYSLITPEHAILKHHVTQSAKLMIRIPPSREVLA